MKQATAPSRPVSAVLGISIVLPAIFLAAALPLIFLGYDHGRGAADQNDFHLPVIHSFASQWPHPDLSDYASATTPGYHLIIAAVERVFHVSGERPLRLASAVFTVMLLALMGRRAAQSLRGIAPLVLCLPIVSSLYIFTSGAWVLPDNLGWLCVLAALLLSLGFGDNLRAYMASLFLISATVMVRQSNLWIIAPLGVAALWPAAWPTSFPECSSRVVRRGALIVAISLPAIIMLGLFFHLWHGVVPPQFQAGHTHGDGSSHTGANFAMPAAILSTVALLAPAYLGWFINSGLPGRMLASASLALAGFLASTIPNTSFNVDAGRWSGVWNLANRAPVFGGRSILVLVLATLGGAMCGFILWSIPLRARFILLTASVAYAAAQTANHQSWQRYIDPFVLMILVLAVCERAKSEPLRESSAINLWRLAPAALGLALAAVTAISLR